MNRSNVHKFFCSPVLLFALFFFIHKHFSCSSKITGRIIICFRENGQVFGARCRVSLINAKNDVLPSETNVFLVLIFHYSLTYYTAGWISIWRFHILWSSTSATVPGTSAGWAKFSQVDNLTSCGWESRWVLSYPYPKACKKWVIWLTVASLFVSYNRDDIALRRFLLGV